MATSTYEQVLHEAQQLTPEEQLRLREALAAETSPSSTSPLVAFLRSVGPLDPEVADEMERVIDEQFEYVDERD